jgi:hypothetical protein
MSFFVQMRILFFPLLAYNEFIHPLAPGQSHPKRESDTIENPPRGVRRMVYNKERVRDASTFQKVRQYEFPTASYLIPVSMWRK